MLQDWLAGKDQVGLMIQNYHLYKPITDMEIEKARTFFDLLTEDDY